MIFAFTVFFSLFAIVRGQFAERYPYIQIQTAPQYVDSLPSLFRDSPVAATSQLSQAYQPTQYQRYFEDSRGNRVQLPADQQANIATRKIRLTHRYFVPTGPTKVFYRRIPYSKFQNEFRPIEGTATGQSPLGMNPSIQEPLVFNPQAQNPFAVNPQVQNPVAIEAPRFWRQGDVKGASEIHEIITNDNSSGFKKRSALA